ncbi:putative RelE/StbE family addiction module toxin [Campylobacter sputorum subsp. bubulus]|uniref:Putative RelE/StbE family addiction module toxin n=1 Tax=Campylobacter sputorum subsp. sputorum TaxID=32024 RepID=A0A381DLX8_9BACT|nr:type II toxin-antitoxin system mRNA interferase toxin, RelE/StbE family [Campylobacter sputorum]ASM34904.1 putative toxin-antitoxin system, toxin component [Campylobacter sputorum aubsp. sputorum RM3237]KAB0581965.1 type II toxin-antitoxin system mRNA interferase toxin, RelE/StbE family [Campylobacter sputorum subsp. sputorum]QEL05095.1 toxin-antitoxin system, toxin component, YafQ family [Campylobacter sputorum subsp. sputorum]SUX11590.1 putative RelE/StbE family addiction module toxin [Cam
MTKFKVAYTKNFKKSFKKIKHDKDLVNELKKVVNMLTNGEILDKRYKNHSI